jgi:Carboxypeptidase regulatory-like domain
MNCKGRVTHENGKYVVANARVALYGGANETAITRSGDDGAFQFSEAIPDGKYKVKVELFGEMHEKEFDVTKGQDSEVSIDCGDLLELELLVETGAGQLASATMATAGERVIVRAEVKAGGKNTNDFGFRWKLRPDLRFSSPSSNDIDLVPPIGREVVDVEVIATEKNAAADSAASIKKNRKVHVRQGEIRMVDISRLPEPIGVRLHRTQSDPTCDQALWVAIRNRTHAISFNRYQDFMNRALPWESRDYHVPQGVDQGTRDRIQRDLNELGTHLHGVKAYQTLKLLTEAFLLVECGVRIEGVAGERRAGPCDFDEEACRLGRSFSGDEMEEKLKAYLGDRDQLPYITRVVKAAFPELEKGWGGRLISARINEPCLIELIWSYWMEEGMLVQTMNAVSRRFQNVRGGGDRDPLANMEIDSLRPLNNLLWGYVQDEFNRLTVRRRAYEYIHHYGLTLFGKAASDLNVADRRSKFLEAFHNLLYQASIFFKEDFQTTVIADGFQLLNSLKEVHLVLAQGAQNQFGDLPWTARVEMLMMQYMLARREIRDFLQSRAMVPYKEPWEAQVDTMKTLQGWTDTTVSHFRDLAVYGEQILLSIRYADWINVNNEDSAKNWARYFRPEIQGYLHAYRAATGIDLTNGDTVDATIPGILLQKRTVMQRTR